MKRTLAILLAAAMLLGLAACGGKTAEPDKAPEPSAPTADPAPAAPTTEPAADPAPTGEPTTEPAEPAPPAEPAGQTVKVGLICIGDENDQGYTYNFIRGKEAVTEQLAADGINVEWLTKYNIGEDSTCEEANIELAEAGCQLIINIPTFSSSPAPTRPPGATICPTPTTPLPTSMRAAIWPASPQA